MKDTTRIYGTVTIGTKGQVVIPVKARKALNIKPGEQLIVMSGPPGRNEILTLLPTKHTFNFLNTFEKHISRLKKELTKKKDN